MIDFANDLLACKESAESFRTIYKGFYTPEAYDEFDFIL
jgi:hypothetical protein